MIFNKTTNLSVRVEANGEPGHRFVVFIEALLVPVRTNKDDLKFLAFALNFIVAGSQHWSEATTWGTPVSREVDTYTSWRRFSQLLIPKLILVIDDNDVIVSSIASLYCDS